MGEDQLTAVLASADVSGDGRISRTEYVLAAVRGLLQPAIPVDGNAYLRAPPVACTDVTGVGVAREVSVNLRVRVRVSWD